MVLNQTVTVVLDGVDTIMVRNVSPVGKRVFGETQLRGRSSPWEARAENGRLRMTEIGGCSRPVSVRVSVHAPIVKAMTSDETRGLPVRPQQPPPGDVVQQQLRLLVMAVSGLQDAVSQTDRKHLSSGRSMAPTTARVGELAHQVAELGDWVDSLIEVGTHVIDGDQEYVVGESDRAPGS